MYKSSFTFIHIRPGILLQLLIICIRSPFLRTRSYFLRVFLLFLSTHFLQRSKLFHMTYGFSPIGSAAMPISWKCPLIKRAKTPKLRSILRLTATY